MTMDKDQIAVVFERIAQILELKGENTFKVRAYQNAARSLESLDEDLGELISSGEIQNIRGIGKNLASHIKELHQTGKLGEYDELVKSVPPGVIEMLAIQGLGPKKVRVLWEKLNIKTVATLELVCRQGRIAELPGFGEKTQEKILQGIQFLKRFQGQHLFCDAYAQAAELLQIILKCTETIRAEIAGSIRRRKEVIGDIDILASSKDAEPLMNAFTSHASVEAVTAKGTTKSSVVLKSGINADLRVVSDDEYPFALHYFTGSKDHNVAMRSLAKKQGKKLSEYGLFKGDKPTPCKDETAIFKALGLSFIEPELRENMGEMKAAADGTLPELITWDDLKGILHVHSNHSDGTASIEEMAKAAKDMGMTYLGIADHSVSASYAGGLTPKEVEKQHQEIDRINKRLKGFRIFKGIECDITKDGTLDYDESVLTQFDFVIASVHSNFGMDEKTMTRRICKALEDPHCSMLAHPTGRLLLSREGYPVDIAKIIDCAAANGVDIEINANPYRLDLDWRWCHRAKEKGIRLAINPDAHSPDGLQHTAFGLGIARKGWLEKNDVLNTMTARALARYWNTQ